ncbi:MAG: hypothetical protein KDA33_13530 [Phycisphaerales bacterium]|nr:hypothetical protein [Phycisphaerales bacterium]
MEDKNFDMLREIEESERWLAGFESPAPSVEAMAGLKRAVRDELAARRGRQFAMKWRAWHGALAAAAMLVISVGVVRYATVHTAPSSFVSVQDALALLPDVPDVETSIEVSTLDELGEMSIGESWALSGSSMYETFEDALSDDSTDEPGEVGAMAPAASEAIG